MRERVSVVQWLWIFFLLLLSIFILFYFLCSAFEFCVLRSVTVWLIHVCVWHLNRMQDAIKSFAFMYIFSTKSFPFLLFLCDGSVSRLLLSLFFHRRRRRLLFPDAPLLLLFLYVRKTNYNSFIPFFGLTVIPLDVKQNITLTSISQIVHLSFLNLVSCWDVSCMLMLTCFDAFSCVLFSFFFSLNSCQCLQFFFLLLSYTFNTMHKPIQTKKYNTFQIALLRFRLISIFDHFPQHQQYITSLLCFFG